MITVDEIRRRALDRFAGAAELEAALPTPRSSAELAAEPDDRYLSLMSRRIFRAGLKHSMVDGRWPAFEEAFAAFNPAVCAAMSDEQLEMAMAHPGVIRHWGKIRAIRDNALMVTDICAAHGSVGRWLADWPTSDIVGLWGYLKQHGSQLGGNSGPYFLRMAGKDTFVLTPDVVAALVNFGVVDRKPTSAKALAIVQDAFNAWHDESGLPLCKISRMLSYCA